MIEKILDSEFLFGCHISTNTVKHEKFNKTSKY